MALIATWDFHRVSSKRIGEIANSCFDDLEIMAHTLKEDMFRNFLRESVFVKHDIEFSDSLFKNI